MFVLKIIHKFLEVLSIVPGMMFLLDMFYNLGKKYFFLKQNSASKTDFSFCCKTADLHYFYQFFILQDVLLETYY